jgi:HD-like signal output (HDOD) protein
MQSPILKQRCNELWKHSVDIAAYSQALAQHTPGLDPDVALLAGLLHDIGELSILSYAKNYSDYMVNVGLLDEVVNELKPVIGDMVLNEWRFPRPLSDAAKYAEQWYRDTGKQASYSDVVNLAHIIMFIHNGESQAMPDLEKVRAFSKLGTSGIEPEDCVKIIRTASKLISETRELLN